MNTKTVIALSIFLIMNGVNAFSQENGMLRTGIVRHVSYTINSIEQSNIVKSLSIRQPMDGFYELEIEHKDSASEYFGFRIENVVRNGKTQTGQLKEIYLEDTSTLAYHDDNAVGIIAIESKKNLATIEIRMRHSYNKDDPQTSYKIVWKHKKSKRE